MQLLTRTCVVLSVTKPAPTIILLAEARTSHENGTSQNNGNDILLIGEPGVGKSSVLELIANVLLGNAIDHCDFDTLGHNEQCGSNNQRQANSAHLYTLTSKNGTVVRYQHFERGE
jgi:DNA replication protein DnaC